MPIYIAAEEVEVKDPDYIQLVNSLAADHLTPNAKIEAAKKISQRLFGSEG
jgi:hypothetical protein